MITKKRVFLAFPGFDVAAVTKRVRVGPVEIWNLKLMTQAEFDRLITGLIDIVNIGIRKNRYSDGDDLRFKKAYDSSTWGLLLPDYTESGYEEGRYVAYMVISLYTDMRPPVTFSVTSFGVKVENEEIWLGASSQFHAEDAKYSSVNFHRFYKEAFPVVNETQFNSAVSAKWNKHQWRLCLARILFTELEKYQYSKKVLTWQQECAEIVTIYETLLSRWRNDNGKSLMIQRIEVLIGNSLSDCILSIRSDLRRLFEYRNEFVHGELFERLKKKSSKGQKTGFGALPDVDFEFLRRQASLVRLVFVCILYLTKILRPVGDNTIQEVIEDGVMNLHTRKMIQLHCAKILSMVNHDLRYST